MEDKNDIDFTSLEAKESSGFKRKLAGIIDASLTIAVFIVVIMNLSQEISDRMNKPPGNFIYVLILFILYRLFTILLLDETLGMRICKIRFLNGNYRPLSLGEKVAAAFFILVNGTDYYEKRE